MRRPGEGRDPVLAHQLLDIGSRRCDGLREQLPVSADCGLLTLDNVIVSPHSAGHSYEARFRRANFSWENIARVVSGKIPAALAG